MTLSTPEPTPPLTDDQSAAPQRYKRCPRCGFTVKADAKVCTGDLKGARALGESATTPPEGGTDA